MPACPPSLYSRQRNAGKSRLFLTVFINTVLLEDWRLITDFDFLFWERGGLSAFLKAEFDVYYFLFKLPVCDMKNFYTNCQCCGSGSVSGSDQDSMWSLDPDPQTLLMMQKSRVYPPVFCRNYFHKKSTLFENSIPIFMKTAWYPRKESTHKKVLRGFFSSYF
jgi:hypothetical protein